MISAARVESHRRNAKLSTGPRTAEGKRKVSQNAHKHGYRAADRILTLADQAAIAECVKLFTTNPLFQTPEHQPLCEILGRAYWHINRFLEMERRLMTGTDYEAIACQLYSLNRYHAHYELVFYQTLEKCMRIARTKPTPTKACGRKAHLHDQSQSAAAGAAKYHSEFTSYGPETTHHRTPLTHSAATECIPEKPDRHH